MRNCLLPGGFCKPGPSGPGGAAGSQMDDQTGGDSAKSHCKNDEQRRTAQSSVQSVRATVVSLLCFTLKNYSVPSLYYNALYANLAWTGAWTLSFTDLSLLCLSRLLELLQDYSSVVDRIPPLLLPLMQPFINRVEAALSPGLTTLSWTALNTNGCKQEYMINRQMQKNI